MRNMKALLSLSLFTMFLLFSTFTPVAKAVKQPEAKIVNYAWYSSDGTFVAWSTLANTLVVTGGDLNPANGTAVAYGWTGGGYGLPPSGTLVYTVYTHP